MAEVRPPSFQDWALRIPEPKAGVLDFGRFPFQRELYAETGSLREVLVVKATQIGISAYLVRWAMYPVDVFGLTGLYVFPKAAQMYDFSDTRVGTLIKKSNYLSGRVPRSHVQNKGLKQIGAGFLYFRGSESQDALESVDADVLALDEYDNLVAENVPVAERRLTGSNNPMTRRVGVPSVPGFGLDGLYADSDQRRWWVRCESCRHRQPVFFTPMHDEADGVANGYVDHERELVVCGKCHKPLDVALGEWVAKYPDRTKRGYHASRLIVPAVARNDNETLHGIIVASHKTEVFEVQSFYNRDLGEAYAPKEGRLSLEVLRAAQRDGVLTVPSYQGQNLVTMGVDVASVRALNVKISEHLSEGVKRTLWIGTVNSFDELAELMDNYGVHMCGIDHLPEGRLARAFANRFPGRVYLIALSGTQNEILTVNEEEAKATVRRTEAIDAMMAQIRGQRNYLPMDLPEGYAKQMQAAVRFAIKDELGKVVVGYRSSGADDYMQAEVYDLMARELLAYRATMETYQGVIEPLEKRFEFSRAHLNEPEKTEGQFNVGPGNGGPVYSPGFDDEPDLNGGLVYDEGDWQAQGWDDE